MTNRKCKVSIKEVHILNFEEYNNLMIFIFFIFFAQIGIAYLLEHNKKSHNSKIEWKLK
jgi:hypothetical protein